ncbi:MAG TPA: hypothetical protein DCR43_05765 [Bacteroidales bacterium]|nr:MAG: hypothetical protein A2X09_15025 [Bacteroidetes bacterium GWF2_43_11]HAQ65342.1 hypothetical protein [Bacteroidales bacterium]
MVLPVVLVFGQGSRLKQIKAANVFDVKSGKIVYKLEGTTKGTRTLIWDDYGRLQYDYKVTVTKIMGMSNSEENLSIRTKEWMYSIDLEAKTGSKMKVDDALAMTDAMTAGYSDEQLQQTGEEIKKQFDAKDVGTGVVLGHTCNIMQIEKLKSKVWTYKKITLKSEMAMGGLMGSSTEEATSMEENITVPASTFQVPAGIEIQDASKMMEGMPGMDDEEDE